MLHNIINARFGTFHDGNICDYSGYYCVFRHLYLCDSRWFWGFERRDIRGGSCPLDGGSLPDASAIQVSVGLNMINQ